MTAGRNDSDRLVGAERDIAHLQGEVEGLHAAKRRHSDQLQELDRTVTRMDEQVKRVPQMADDMAQFRGSLKVAIAVVGFGGTVIGPILTVVLMKYVMHL